MWVSALHPASSLRKKGFQNVQNILGKIYIQTILAVFDPRFARIACGMLKAFIRPWCPCFLVRRALNIVLLESVGTHPYV